MTLVVTIQSVARRWTTKCCTWTASQLHAAKMLPWQLATEYCIARKFGGLVVYLNNRQIKIHQNFLLAYIRMAILYRTAKLKSANTFAMAIWDPTAKFNSRQYFRLYGIPNTGLQREVLLL